MEVVHFEDIEYTVAWELANDHVMRFKVFNIVVNGYWKDNVKYDNKAYTKAGATSNMDTTEELSEAQVFMSGDIKWDGCSNIMFDEQENCMLHFCSREGASNVGVLLGRLYQLASDVIPNADKDMLS